MRVREAGYEVRNQKWDSIVKGTLSNSYVANSQDLLWAIDTHRKLIFANTAYLNYMYRTTGAHLHVDDYAWTPDGNAEMTDKWDYFYTRALNGERFNIITNFASKKMSMIVDANFIPLMSDNHVLGTACLARSTSSIILPDIEAPDDDNDQRTWFI